MDRPPFAYTIDALRVDGHLSADPYDYKKWSDKQVIGQELVAFLVGHLSSELSPKGEKGRPTRIGARGPGMSWALDHGVVIARRPTKLDLERWSRVDWVTIDIYGNIRPHEVPLNPINFASA